MKIRVKSLSFDTYGFVTMMDDRGRMFVELDSGHSYWLPEADLQQVIYLCDCSPNYCCCTPADREFSAKLEESLNMNQIRVKVKGLDAEGVVIGAGGNDMILVEFSTGVRDWFRQPDLVVIIDTKEIDGYLAANMDDLFAIKEPKGILHNMARQVRLMVGEAADRIEIGVADIQPVPDDDTLVILTITHPKIAQMLGGERIVGTIPRHVEPAPDIQPQPEEGEPSD